MDDTVTHSFKAGVVADMRREPIVNCCDGAGVACTRNGRVGKFGAVRIADFQVGRGPDALDLAMSARGKRPVGRSLEYRELDTGRAGIDDEDWFAHRGHPIPTAAARCAWE
jgi:hypothetical protein